MIRWLTLLFAGLTVSAAAMTYYNIGLEETRYDDPSVRSGSAGVYGGSGGYRYGK